MGAGSFVVLCVQLSEYYLAQMGRSLKNDRDRAKIAGQVVKKYGRFNTKVIRRFVATCPLGIILQLAMICLVP